MSLCHKRCWAAEKTPLCAHSPQPPPPALPHHPAGASQCAAVTPGWPRSPAPALAPVRHRAGAGQQGDAGSQPSGTASTGTLLPALLRPGPCLAARRGARPHHSRLPSCSTMGQANCCGAWGTRSPAPGTQAQPGGPGYVAPGGSLGLLGRGASRPPALHGAFVSRRSPQLLLSDRAQVTRHRRTRDRHILLFPNAIAIASFK